MRTFALLTAMLLLVALHAQAEARQARADEAAAQQQPGADDQGMAHSFTRPENAALPLSESARGLRCLCRRGVCQLL
ncbi:rhesus theta defensin-1/2 subunit B isoform X4 [Macaca thibetana thibetana]|uniref:Rhesus theta defensin-1/2 subunit B n=1 Tax=Macaca mulatta TaxID=9544 RepID=RTD1B_MACMU|nr:rhesus theta defensin-1/2 subunit B precursor [Macaca mulatta]XP_050657105.1 rhesus theta defensin-1/2 subunit B isoform X4 [Macaca thibetana thibetana]P82271.1 RecName: Full=Rhesus theta defensin-1/2 subunit B; Short=RTD-1 subunit B; Short=RTD-1b; AltName: Full=Demidefensin-1; AltName: Full=RTD-2; Flags: Precursor [Macaca mulatta]AAF04390.1 theta defensin 1b precursor [Macaca mulatta]AAF04392.1 theta defensin 1b precursor [Macaca mulatta]AAF07923.1 demidefensin 1 [Macaca mulatta]